MKLPGGAENMAQSGESFLKGTLVRQKTESWITLSVWKKACVNLIVNVLSCFAEKESHVGLEQHDGD